ncbi:MAG: hypothetical protein K2M11_06200, partial [Paramuribaculum sp.]|nr:hypothetical protein [Paramuribaculum sp.]
MPRTKISKAATDLNVAVPTIIEFLRKKGITVDDSPNARIDEDVYEILVKEYKPDRVLKSKSEQMSVDRQAAKAKTSPRAEEIKIEPAPTRGPKVIGKIDLATGKPAQEPQKEQPAEQKPSAPEAKKEEPAKKPQQQPQPQQEAPKAPVAEPVAQKQEAKPVEPVKEAPVQKPAPAPKAEKPRHEKHEKHAPAPQAKEAPKNPAPKAPAPKVEAPKAEKPAEPKKETKPAEPEVFTLGTPKVGPQIKVIGKIDLSTITQS